MLTFGDVIVRGVTHHPNVYISDGKKTSSIEPHLQVEITGSELDALNPTIEEFEKRFGDFRRDLMPPLEEGVRATLGILPNAKVAYAPGWPTDSSWIFAGHGGLAHVFLPPDIASKILLSVKANLEGMIPSGKISEADLQEAQNRIIDWLA